MFKKNFFLVLWLGVLNLPLAIYSGLAYAPSFEASPWFVVCTFIFASIGQYFFYFALLSLILIFPVFSFKEKLGKWRFLYATAIISILHIILSTDAHVFELYRFHINYAMLDLFFNAGGEVIEFSTDTWISIALQVVGIIVYSMIVLGIGIFLAAKKIHIKLFIILICLMYVIANLVHAYSSAKQLLPIVELQNRIPLYRPLTMNTLLIKVGLVDPDELNNRKVNLSNKGLFNYPKKELSYFSYAREPYNVVILAVDTLRADMLTQENMPNTFEFSKDAIVFSNHYSSSNSTRGGIFGLFYGLPPSYWQVALTSGIPSALVKAAQDRNYHVNAFTSANLYKPEFNQTVFAGVKDLRLDSVGNNAIERDQDAMKDFSTFLKSLTPDSKFFSFIFLDNVHSYAHPSDVAPFKPALTEVNHLDLNNKTDPTPVFNLYKNAVYYADMNIKKILDEIQASPFADNTIIIITSDHGEEFNDNKDNYWGHNSNFTDAQSKIPLIIKWPNKRPQVISDLTSAYDISATLLPNVFGVRNRISDYSIGQNLFERQDIKYVLVGSYLENAIIEKDRIVVIDKFGILNFLDKHYRPTSNHERDAYLFDALKSMAYYLQNDNDGSNGITVKEANEANEAKHDESEAVNQDNADANEVTDNAEGAATNEAATGDESAPKDGAADDGANTEGHNAEGAASASPEGDANASTGAPEANATGAANAVRVASGADAAATAAKDSGAAHEAHASASATTAHAVSEQMKDAA